MVKLTPRSRRMLVGLIWTLLLPMAAVAQSGPVRYTLSLDKSPASHLLTISMDFNAGNSDSVDVAMPAWSPGAYGIGNYWKNVQEFSATGDGGAPLAFEKVDKQTWRVQRGSSNNIQVKYKLYYPEYDYQHCYMRGPSVYMYVIGNRPYPMSGPVSLKLEGVPESWHIETGMEQGSDANSFNAPNYDTFIDASMVAGSNLSVVQFEYQSVPYHLVFIGAGNWDKEKIARDVKTVTSNLVDMMGGAPYKKYVFFLRAARGAGGLEHLNSTDMSISAYETHATPANYSRFLFVVAHEFFHLWNVKRIRPSILGPFDYSHEQNTRNLYVSEGMTSYWASIGLKRSGLWDRQAYFNEFLTQVKQLQSSPGRKIMSVELSSWDTWGRSDNAANNSIDYYNKGELLGNLLDLEIRYRTKNQRSLTDVFQYLLKTHGLPKPGFEERRGFRDAVELITRQAAPDNSDFGDFFKRYVSGTEEIPWNDFLGHAGLELEVEKSAPHTSVGITVGTSFNSNFPGAIPTSTAVSTGQLAVTHIEPGSAAETGGLQAGDLIVALDGDKIVPDNYDAIFGKRKKGDTVVYWVLRGERLVNVSVVVDESQDVKYSLKTKADASDLQKEIFKSWLAEKEF